MLGTKHDKDYIREYYPDSYIISIEDYTPGPYTPSKLMGIIKLLKAGVPTVSNVYIILPKVFREYKISKTLPKKFIKELKQISKRILSSGNTITLRPSVYSPLLTLDVLIQNRLNISNFENVKFYLEKMFKKGLELEMSEKIDLSIIMYPFYSVRRCGTMITADRNNKMLIDAIFGEHTKLITRKCVKCDSYVIDINTKKIKKHIPKKSKTLIKSDEGLDYKELAPKEAEKPVLTDEEILKAFKYGMRIGEIYGHPKFLEWAFLPSGEMIFWDMQPMKKIDGTYITGELTFVRERINLEELKNKIIVFDTRYTNKRDIFNLIAQSRTPKAVLMPYGGKACSLSIILREFGVQTYFPRNLNQLKLKNGDKITIDKYGFIEKIS